MAEALRASIDWKSAFSLQQGQFDPKILGRRGSLPASFFLSENYVKWSFMWYKNVGTSFLRFIPINPRVWQTDRRRERHWQYSELCSMQSHDKNHFTSLQQYDKSHCVYLARIGGNKDVREPASCYCNAAGAQHWPWGEVTAKKPVETWPRMRSIELFRSA